MKETLIEKMAKFVHGFSFKAIPSDVAEIAKAFILDALGSPFVGGEMEPMRSMIELVRESRSVGEASIMGYDIKVSPADAAFANAALIHSQLHEDFSGIVDGHVAPVVISAALAIAEQENRSGEEFLTSVVIGYELMDRIGRAIVPKATLRGFRGMPVLGTFGAASAAGKLLRLDEEKIGHALGLAANFSGGLKEWAHEYNGDVYFVHAGMASRSGIIAALLASKGVKGPKTALEGDCGFFKAFAEKVEDIDQVLSELGVEFKFTKDILFKPKAFPVAGSNVSPAYVLIHMMEQYGFNAEDIDRIRATISTEMKGGRNPFIDFRGPFITCGQAQFAMPFALAMAALQRRIPLDLYVKKGYTDPKIYELAKKVELVEEETRGIYKVTVFTKDGKSFTREELRGHVYPPPSRRDIIEKFTEYASMRLPKEKVDRIVKLTLDLENVENIRELTDSLR